jgi:hypothetical protein
MKKTAVEYLFEKLWGIPKDKFTWQMILKEAKKKEKDQIKIAHLNGQSEWDIKGLRDINKKLAEEYYSETYGDK